MLPDRWNIDVFESACTKVAFYSDPCWMVSDPDNYNRANQALWINYNRIKNRYEELDSPKVRTVRDTIPSSNLAKYGNYEYDDVRENLYETDDTQPLYADDKRYQDSCVEPWMLPEVENEFKRLTAVEEYKLWRPDVRIQRPSTCIDGHIWTCEHSWQIQSWAAMLIFHYPQIVSNIEERSQGSCQRSLYCDGGDVLSELEKYPTPRYSLNSPEAAELHRRVTLPSVRSLWDDSEPAEEPKSCIFTQRTMPLSVDCQPPEYFPSASESHEDLFPYLKQLQPFTTSTPNKSCDQENMDFQSQLMELSSIADKQGPWDRYDEAVCVDDSSEEGDLLDWLQSVYPSRVHDFTALETLMGEMKKIEEQLAEENSKTSCLPASLSTDALAAPSTSTSENTSTSSGATPKRRLYRDVLASTIPAPEVSTAAPVVASPKSETCVAATVSTSSLEKKFEELEQQALEQYRSSDDSIAQHFQELERQAIEQYQPGSSSDSDFSISSCDEQVKEPQPLSSCKTGSKNCDSGIKLKRTHSHHDLVLAGRPRPAAASRSVCNMGPGTAASAAVIAATRPETLWAECGQGSGDRLPTKGNTTRRNLLLDSPDRRTRKALSLSTDDSSDSEHDESTLLTLPSLSSRPTARPRGRRGSEIVERKLLTSPTSIRGRRKALAAAHRIKADRGDGGGGGDDKPTEEVIIVPRNDAGPNEKRTQVSHRPRIQSANISKGGPVEAGVTETWVQPTFQPKMRATLLIDQEEKFPRADLQTLGSPQYPQLKKRKRGRRRKKKKNRLVLPKPLPVSSSFRYLIHGLNFTELYFEGSTFRIRMWRLIGLVPYTVIENGSNISPKREVIKNMSNYGMLLFLQGNRLFHDWSEDRKHYRSCWESKKDVVPKVSVYDTKTVAQNNWSAMAIKLFLEKTEIPYNFRFPWKEVRSWIDYKSVLDLIMTEHLDRKDRHEANHKNICSVRDASTQTAPTIVNIIQSEKQKCCCRGEMLATLARALQVVRCRCLVRKWNSSSAFLDSVASNSSKRNSVQWRRSSLFGVQRPWCSEDTMASTSFLASTINSPQGGATSKGKDVVDDESSSNCTHIHPYDVADETLPNTVPSVKLTYTNERPETANRINKFQPSPHLIDSQSWMKHKPTSNITYRPGDKPECEIIQIEPDVKRGTLSKPASEDEFKWTDKFLRRQKYKRKNDDVSGYIKQKKTQTCSVL